LIESPCDTSIIAVAGCCIITIDQGGKMRVKARTTIKDQVVLYISDSCVEGDTVSLSLMLVGIISKRGNPRMLKLVPLCEMKTVLLSEVARTKARMPGALQPRGSIEVRLSRTLGLAPSYGAAVSIVRVTTVSRSEILI
jgi:hypothetical protein